MLADKADAGCVIVTTVLVVQFLASVTFKV